MQYLSNLLIKSNSVDESRIIINNNLDSISNELGNILEKYNISYNINYGNNFFPKKTYNSITFKEGFYESLVITLGKGEGDNWWCFLFPPFCFVDSVDNGTDKIEYKSYIKEIFSNLFK